MIVQEFDLTIKHRSGRSNVNADAIQFLQMNLRLLCSLDDATELRHTEQLKDPELAAVVQFVQEGVVLTARHSMTFSMVFFTNRTG